MLLSPFQWKASFAFNILSIIGAPVQFAPAVTSLPWPILLLLPGWDQPLGLQSCFLFPALASQISANSHHVGSGALSPCKHWTQSEFGCALGSFGFVRTFLICTFKDRNQSGWEGGLPGECHGWARTGPECTHIGIRSSPEALWFIPLDHFMNL